MKRILIVDDVKGWRDFNSQAVKAILGDECEIIQKECARDAYDVLLQNESLDIIITDLQMEDDFTPKYAGEWFVEQIKTFSKYVNTKIIIISATYNIRTIAKNYEVFCIPKSTARTCLSAYEEILK